MKLFIKITLTILFLLICIDVGNTTFRRPRLFNLLRGHRERISMNLIRVEEQKEPVEEKVVSLPSVKTTVENNVTWYWDDSRQVWWRPLNQSEVQSQPQTQYYNYSSPALPRRFSIRSSCSS